MRHFIYPALLILAASLSLTGCDKKPAVPEVTDADKPTDFDGSPMTREAFVQKYCMGEGDATESCRKVRNAISINFGKMGGLPKGW